jgi:hypothetical protein
MSIDNEIRNYAQPTKPAEGPSIRRFWRASALMDFGESRPSSKPRADLKAWNAPLLSNLSRPALSDGRIDGGADDRAPPTASR